MSIFERIQKLIKEQNITVKQLERECDLANATIRRWETQTPNIESVRRVAQKLGTSIDYLVTGSSSNTNDPRFEVYCDGVPLTENEADLVAMYRLLDAPDRKTVFDIAKLKYQQKTGEEISIYSTYFDENETQKSGTGDDDNTASGTA